MRNRIKIFSVCLSVFLAAGCFNLKQPRNRVENYTLEYPSPQMRDLKPLPVSLKVGRFSVASPYNTQHIIYREGPFLRDEYFYHKWRANPGDMVSDFLVRDMRNSGLFRAVLPYGSDTDTSFSLEGSVDEFLEWDTPEGCKAVLAITVAVTDPQEPDVSRQVRFQKSYREEKALTEKGGGGLAKAMSMAMEAISAAILRDVYSSLQAEL